MAESVPQIWESSLRTIESQIKPHNFDLWIRPIECLGIEGSTIVLRAPNRFIKEWFEDHYLPAILDAAEAIARQRFRVSFHIVDEGAAAAPPADGRAFPPTAMADGAAREERSRARLAAGAPAALDGAAAGVVSALPVLEDSGPIASRPVVAANEAQRLPERYQFDTFVEGPSNQLALAAALAVAELPGSKYNPLFVYGGSGLGKTHLLCAIGHALQKRHPGWRLLYLKAESYMNEYISLVRNGRIEEFRRKYREHCDVLLMDDIQFLAGKDRTQEEFFHTFNSLFESHKQMVFTADRFPHEIPDLEDRIRSRFQWGLIADIQPPELETRIAILMKKAAMDGIELPRDVAIYLATNIKSNVRELEGLLIRVAAVASLSHRPITVEFAAETLKHFVSQASGSITIEQIQKEVANYFRIKPAELKSHKRHQLIARPRQIAMYLARKLVKASFPEIGQRFGGKDHTTVMSACRKIDDLVSSDPKTRAIVDQLERILTH